MRKLLLDFKIIMHIGQGNGPLQQMVRLMMKFYSQSTHAIMGITAFNPALGFKILMLVQRCMPLR